MKAGTFTVSDNGVVICRDNQTFAYNITGGNCVGTGVTGFVNYQTGDYQVSFTTAPVFGHTLIASWTNIISASGSGKKTRLQNIDEMGDGTSQSGFVSSRFAKFPGGISGQIWASQGTDESFIYNSASPFHNGHPFGAPGYSEMMSWLVGVKFPALVPNNSPSTSFFATYLFRLERPASVTTDLKEDILGQWAQDVATKSTFSGTVSSGVLTLTANAGSVRCGKERLFHV